MRSGLSAAAPSTRATLSLYLRAAGHLDADLDARLVPSYGDTLGLRLGFISGVSDPTTIRAVQEGIPPSPPKPAQP
jgi:hypothetical protein